ncbi:hypothetical protein [Paraconexibacter algicola]|uniref:Uncharacterized protein n=1 Tax=Paraconexibacter algicola TaxID=2133960 RepID=A0A2T4UEB7_9ACTN|nr:hypothetical protein [Paraconexibacter algicola]PTL55762.1 hypothetical protein C7Y72_19225 [Paraconexibacter algicola]
MSAPPTGRDAPPRVEELAALCVGGMIAAGVDLVERLRSLGVEPTIDKLVAIAVPTRRIGCEAFDRLADALAAAVSLRELDEEP